MKSPMLALVALALAEWATRPALVSSRTFDQMVANPDLRDCAMESLR